MGMTQVPESNWIPNTELSLSYRIKRNQRYYLGLCDGYPVELSGFTVDLRFKAEGCPPTPELLEWLSASFLSMSCAQLAVVRLPNEVPIARWQRALGTLGLFAFPQHTHCFYCVCQA